MELTAVFWDLLREYGVTPIKVDTSCKHKKNTKIVSIGGKKIPSGICPVCQRRQNTFKIGYAYDETTRINYLSAAAHSTRVARAQAWANSSEDVPAQTRAAEESIFSPQAPELMRTLVLEKCSPRKKQFVYRDRKFIMKFFQECSWENRDINSISPSFQQFKGLTECILSNNKLSKLENLPSNLKVLNAFGNCITSLDFNGKRPARNIQQISSSSGRVFKPTPPFASTPPLLHLGLGYNQLADCFEVMSLSKTLKSLDLSYNNLCSLADVVRSVRSIPQLEYLWLAGNPLCLNLAFPVAIQQHCKNLKFMEGFAVEKKLSTSFPHELLQGADIADGDMFVEIIKARNMAQSLDSKTGVAASTSSLKRGNAKLNKRELQRIEDKEREERAQAAQAFNKKWRQTEKQLAVDFLRSDQGLNKGVELAVVLDTVTGIADPTSEMEMRLEKLEKQWTAKYTQESSNGVKKDGAKKKNSKESKAKAVAAKKRSKNEAEEESRKIFEHDAEFDFVTEAGDDVSVAAHADITVTYFVQYRLADTEMHSTEEREWKKEIALEYGLKQVFTPSTLHRDLVLLLGVDFALYRKIVTVTRLESTKVRHVLVVPEDATPPSTEVTPRERKAVSNKRQVRGKKSKKSQQNKTEYRDETSVSTAKTVDVDVVSLGSLHVSLASFMAPRASNTMACFRIKKQAPIVEASRNPLQTQYEHVHPRLVPSQYHDAVVVKSAAVKTVQQQHTDNTQVSTSQASNTASAEQEVSVPEISFTITLNAGQLLSDELLAVEKTQFLDKLSQQAELAEQGNVRNSQEMTPRQQE